MIVGIGFLGTAESRAALTHAIQECAVHGADLVVIVADAIRATPDFATDLTHAERELGERRVSVRPVPSESEVARELIDLSYEKDVELLVMGMRRRSPVGKLLLGSLTQQVLLDAHCPVTAVKPPVTTVGD